MPAPGRVPPTRVPSVGLVGAGPWASMVHAPTLAAHPRVRLEAVWARRPEAAAALAARYDTAAVDTYEQLLDRCDAVVFAVPPDVQAALALVAAEAGRGLLLEKPLALDLPAAQRLVDAVEAAGVATRMNLTWRYSPAVRAFVDAVATVEPIGGRAHFLSGGYLEGPFATPWRREGGLLLDLGPHVIDVLDVVLGPVVGIRGHGDPRRWVGLLLEHDSGLSSEVSLSAHTDLHPFRAGVEVYTREGALDLDAAAAVEPAAWARVIDEFADDLEHGGGADHELDVHRGLHLQRLLETASAEVDQR